MKLPTLLAERKIIANAFSNLSHRRLHRGIAPMFDCKFARFGDRLLFLLLFHLLFECLVFFNSHVFLRKICFRH